MDNEHNVSPNEALGFLLRENVKQKTKKIVEGDSDTFKIYGFKDASVCHLRIDERTTRKRG